MRAVTCDSGKSAGAVRGHEAVRQRGSNGTTQAALAHLELMLAAACAREELYAQHTHRTSGSTEPKWSCDRLEGVFPCRVMRVDGERMAVTPRLTRQTRDPHVLVRL